MAALYFWTLSSVSSSHGITGICPDSSFLDHNLETLSWYWSESLSAVFYSLWPHGLYSPWNSPGQTTRVGSGQFSQSVVSDLCDRMDHSTPGLPDVHHQLSESTQTHVHWVSDAIQLSHPLLSPSPPAFNLSQHQVFSNESALCIRWPKYWSFSFNISPSNEHPGLFSFRMDWLDLFADQGTLKSLLQHHSSKASILLCSAFFIVQLSDPYMATRVGSLSLFQGIFSTQGSNPGLPHCRRILYQLSHKGSPGESESCSVMSDSFRLRPEYWSG